MYTFAEGPEGEGRNSREQSVVVDMWGVGQVEQWH